VVVSVCTQFQYFQSIQIVRYAFQKKSFQIAITDRQRSIRQYVQQVPLIREKVFQISV